MAVESCKEEYVKRVRSIGLVTLGKGEISEEEVKELEDQIRPYLRNHYKTIFKTEGKTQTEKFINSINEKSIPKDLTV